jgi:phosphoenolpyruvate carboxylase
VADERLKNVGEDRRSTLEDCVRKNAATDERIVQGIHLTINGIAAGLRNSS